MNLEDIAKTIVIQFGKRVSDREVLWFLKEQGLSAPEQFVDDVLVLVESAIVKVRF